MSLLERAVRAYVAMINFRRLFTAAVHRMVIGYALARLRLSRRHSFRHALSFWREPVRRHPGRPGPGPRPDPLHTNWARDKTLKDNR